VDLREGGSGVLAAGEGGGAVRFDYLSPSIDPVVDGLEDWEKIYALEQGQYLPIRTLIGDRGQSAIYRIELTEDQRGMLASGADILVEILHYGGPVAPSRVMLLNQKDLTGEESANMPRWLTDQMKLVNPRAKLAP